jgi:hypothetical protein
VVDVNDFHLAPDKEKFFDRLVNFFTRIQVVRNERRGLTDAFGTLENQRFHGLELRVVFCNV